MPLLFSYEDLKIKLGLDKDIQLLRFDYNSQPGKELLEVILVGESIGLRPLYKDRQWHCKHCDNKWPAPGIEHNCPACTSEDIEEGIEQIEEGL